MAHKTLINETSYEITSGKTLVGGTGCKINKGKTLVGGTEYDIVFEEKIVNITIKNVNLSAFEYSAKVTIDGIVYFDSSNLWEEEVTIQVNSGTLCECYIRTMTGASDFSTVQIDGIEVQRATNSSSATYFYTLTTDKTIEIYGFGWSSMDRYGTIKIY